MVCKIKFDSHINTAEYILEYGASIYNIENYTGGYINNDGLVLYLPFGTSIINYKDHDITVTYEKGKKPVGTQSLALHYKSVQIECDDKKILMEFIKDAREYCTQKKENTQVICYIMVNGMWRSTSRLPKRSFDTIYIEDDYLKIISSK